MLVAGTWHVLQLAHSLRGGDGAAAAIGVPDRCVLSAILDHVAESASCVIASVRCSSSEIRRLCVGLGVKGSRKVHC
jgi:hypothetical protein